MADTTLKATLNRLAGGLDYTALDYSTSQAELIRYITNAQTSQGVTDQFLDSDAAKMLIDLMSYTIELSSFRADTNANEVYLPTANAKSSIIKIIDLVGQNLKNPTTAELSLLAVPSTISNSQIDIPARFSMQVTGLDGNPVTFEIMQEETDYYTPVTIPAAVTNSVVKAFSGSYRSLDVVSTGASGIQITLTDFPVIDGSIKVSVTDISPEFLTPEIISSTRVSETETLTEVTDEIIYRVQYDADGRGILTFATNSFGKIPPAGNTIHVDYRVDGGAATNVSSGAVNASGSFTNANGERISVLFTNSDTFADGGEDQEEVADAKLRIPAEVRANENTVTTDDYEAIVGGLNGVQDVFAVDKYNDHTIYGDKFAVPSNSCFIWVLPSSGGEISPDLRQIIANRLTKSKITAIGNFIFNPDYIDWELSATITLEQNAIANDVRTAIESAVLAKFGQAATSFKTIVS